MQSCVCVLVVVVMVVVVVCVCVCVGGEGHTGGGHTLEDVPPLSATPAPCMRAHAGLDLAPIPTVLGQAPSHLTRPPSHLTRPPSHLTRPLYGYIGPYISTGPGRGVEPHVCY